MDSCRTGVCTALVCSNVTKLDKRTVNFRRPESSRSFSLRVSESESFGQDSAIRQAANSVSVEDESSDFSSISGYPDGKHIQNETESAAEEPNTNA